VTRQVLKRRRRRRRSSSSSSGVVAPVPLAVIVATATETDGAVAMAAAAAATAGAPLHQPSQDSPCTVCAHGVQCARVLRRRVTQEAHSRGQAVTQEARPRRTTALVPSSLAQPGSGARGQAQSLAPQSRVLTQTSCVHDAARVLSLRSDARQRSWQNVHNCQGRPENSAKSARTFVYRGKGRPSSFWGSVQTCARLT
jgi:hypothetical protein